LPSDPHAARLLTTSASNEDAAVLRMPPGKALVQTVDFFTPIVNDPYAFGQIAAANALSDVYAMGGEPWCVMNIVCFPVEELPVDILVRILAGGADKAAEAGAVLAGGHSINDSEIKYGLAVTGFVNSESFSRNTGLRPGQLLMLTKALGTGILATGVKAQWDNSAELEDMIIRSAAKLNAGPGRVIRELGLTAATDITGFGLGGHLLEMAEASDVHIEIETDALPILPHARELAGMGLVPAGSHANRRFRLTDTLVGNNIDPALIDIVFDAQTSGGIVLALEPEQVPAALKILGEHMDIGVVIGRVLFENAGPRLRIT
jgi:selenide,water dikinase